MDSGKTTLVNETLFENDFAEGGKGIIIMCEDGDVEYDLEKLKTVNWYQDIILTILVNMMQKYLL